ncbi:MAG: cysteine desulfurase family protein [Myxococcota bacterium]
MRRVYLDHNATSPMLPEVRAAMAPWWGIPANPSSVHQEGQRARAALEGARREVAAFFGVPPSGVVFTSGATEAAHQAIQMFARAGGTAVISAVEHPCMRHAAELAVGSEGLVAVWDVDATGQLDMPPVREADVVAVQWANHETGIIIERPSGVEGASVVDLTGAAGKCVVSLLGVDAAVVGAHKLGGPVGVGALLLPGTGPAKPLLGGSQERGLRGGTVDVAGAVGFAAACKVAASETERWSRWSRQRERLWATLEATGARGIGLDQRRVPSTLMVCWPQRPAEMMVQLFDLRGLSVSAGAACASGAVSESPVLMAMGDPQPDGGVRFSLGPRTTDEEVDLACDIIRRTLQSLPLADGDGGA